MGKLSEEMRAEARPRKGPPCGIGTALRGMAPADRAELEEALADWGIGPTSLHRVLHRRGFHTSKEAVTKHRRGECNCGQAGR